MTNAVVRNVVVRNAVVRNVVVRNAVVTTVVVCLVCLIPMPLLKVKGLEDTIISRGRFKSIWKCV
jgi:hypothetical protein